jgi:hypothetical protein
MHQSQQLPYNPNDLMTRLTKEAIKADMVKKEEQE